LDIFRVGVFLVGSCSYIQVNTSLKIRFLSKVKLYYTTCGVKMLGHTILSFQCSISAYSILCLMLAWIIMLILISFVRVDWFATCLDVCWWIVGWPRASSHIYRWPSKGLVDGVCGLSWPLLITSFRVRSIFEEDWVVPLSLIDPFLRVGLFRKVSLLLERL